MPVREILQLGNPLLHQRCRDVADPVADLGEVSALIRDLDDTLAAFRSRRGFGRGISAPQIGELARVIFIRVPSLFVGPLLDPRIEWASAERFELWDDCFSFPDLMVRVSRALEIRVGYSDERGARKTLEASGGLAELLQHEIDHLDGILSPERAVSATAFCTRAEWERRHAGRPAMAVADPVSDTKLRRAGPEDVSALVELINRAYRVEDFFVDGNRTDETEIGARMAKPQVSFLVIEDGRSSSPAAAVCLEIRGARGYFSMLAVDPGQQKRGLGRRLVLAAEEHCRAAGCRFLDLDVVDVRLELPGFYAALGFAPFDTAPFPDPTKLRRDAQLILMTKELRR